MDGDLSDVKENVAVVDVVVLPAAGPAVIVVCGARLVAAARARAAMDRHRRARLALTRLLLPAARALQRAFVFARAAAFALAFDALVAAAVAAAVAGIVTTGASAQLSASSRRIGRRRIRWSSSALDGHPECRPTELDG